MPKKKEEVPEKLKAYNFHRLDMEFGEHDKEAVADCPFCGREGKFSIDIKKGLYRCLVCGTQGNHYTFIQELWKVSYEATKEYSWLSEKRNLLFPETLVHWEVVKSTLSGNWMIPGYNAKGKISQLYRYAKVGGKFRLLATPTLTHALHGIYEEDKSEIFLCEGPWDAIMLWELLQESGRLKDACVLATPGCNVFQDSWIPLFEDREVKILFDNDYPKEKDGRTIPPAGYSGAKKIVQRLSSSKTPPASVEYLEWGEGGFSRDFPENYDIGDYLTHTG
jgi:ribosomal protein L37AE/L43A